MLYRGQVPGAPVGEWWTTCRAEAEKFAMSAGGNRTYVVLSLDQDEDEPWLAPYLYARRVGEGRGSWYRIPIAVLREHWRGVRIDGGAVSLEAPGEHAVRGKLSDELRVASGVLASPRVPIEHRARMIRRLLRAQVAAYLQEDADGSELLTKEVREQCTSPEERGAIRDELRRMIVEALGGAHAC